MRPTAASALCLVLRIATTPRAIAAKQMLPGATRPRPPGSLCSDAVPILVHALVARAPHGCCAVHHWRAGMSSVPQWQKPGPAVRSVMNHSLLLYGDCQVGC
jgi:hypothetical protein